MTVYFDRLEYICTADASIERGDSALRRYVTERGRQIPEGTERLKAFRCHNDPNRIKIMAGINLTNEQAEAKRLADELRWKAKEAAERKARLDAAKERGAEIVAAGSFLTLKEIEATYKIYLPEFKRQRKGGMYRGKLVYALADVQWFLRYQAARSETEWRRLGRRLKRGAEPIGRKHSPKGNAFGWIEYPVYEEDQTVECVASSRSEAARRAAATRRRNRQPIATQERHQQHTATIATTKPDWLRQGF